MVEQSSPVSLHLHVLGGSLLLSRGCGRLMYTSIIIVWSQQLYQYIWCGDHESGVLLLRMTEKSALSSSPSRPGLVRCSVTINPLVPALLRVTRCDTRGGPAIPTPPPLPLPLPLSPFVVRAAAAGSRRLPLPLVLLSLVRLLLLLFPVLLLLLLLVSFCLDTFARRIGDGATDDDDDGDGGMAWSRAVFLSFLLFGGDA